MGAGRRTRASTRAAGNSEPMLDHSAAMLNPSHTPSRDINEGLHNDEELPENAFQEPTLDHSAAIRNASHGVTDEELLGNPYETLKDVNPPPVEPKPTSPFSDLPLTLPSSSSHSPKTVPLPTEDDAMDIDDSDRLTPSDSASNPDLATPSPAGRRAAETLFHLRTQQSSVKPPMNGLPYDPNRNPVAVEWNDGHPSWQQQTGHLYPNLRSPILFQSTNFPNPFAGNSSQASQVGASAFGSNQQHSPYFPRAPIVQSYEPQNQYRYGPIQYGQPHYGYPQYGQAQPVEHSWSSIFPGSLGSFRSPLDTIAEDNAAAAYFENTALAGTTQQHFLNTGDLTQANGSRKNLKRKDSDAVDETNTNTRRRRRTDSYVPSSAHDRPSDSRLAPLSDSELERHARQVYESDPWWWTVADVYFSLTNVHSYYLQSNEDLSLPNPHLGLIVRKYKINGSKLLVNLTPADLQGLGITQEDHLTSTVRVIEQMRARSPIYQGHSAVYQDPVPLLLNGSLGPQSRESRDKVVSDIRQHVKDNPLRKGEKRRYHFTFGCYMATLIGSPTGCYNIFTQPVSQCLDERRNSSSSQSSDQQRRQSVSLYSL